MKRRTKISIVGAGSLGSYATLLLADMNYQDIEVYDDDLVEYHNRRNQLFRQNDVGRPKVEALAEIIRFLTGREITYHLTRAGRQTRFSGNVVVVLVDSMQARREIFQGVKYNPRIQLFIEARTGGHSARVYVVNPSDPDGIKRYETDDIFYSDKEAVDAPCSDETTQPTVRVVGAVVAHFIRKWSEGWYPVCEECHIDFNEMPSIDTVHLSI